MMVGEMGFDTLFTAELMLKSDRSRTNMNNTILESNESKVQSIKMEKPAGVYVLYVLFVITVTIALINLLIGLAVSDIKVNKIILDLF